ncbi:MAG: hypothetical protein ACRCTJ_06185 [Brevinema sp.]
MTTRLLGILLLFSSMAHTKIYQDIHLMLPMERSVLAQSMEEVAKVYEEIGNKAKADQYYKVALEVYPLGDRAHVLAEKLNTKLDDEKTFDYYEQEGLRFSNKKNHKAALLAFMMALQIKATFPLYQNLADTYRALKDEHSAATFESLSKGIISK